MADKVQKIRQEIERLKHTSNAYDKSRFMLLEEIESFINSLPEEPVSEDLEEYAKKLAKGAALDKHNLIWMCKKGAEWQKQQMMKDTVEAFVNTYENTDDSNYVEFVTEQSPYKFKETEKCKLIIIKEE